MNKEQKKKIIKIIKSFPEIKVAYLFGSRATGNYTQASDYDLAIYLDNRDPLSAHEVKFSLYGKLSLALKSDKVDIVILDLSKSPVLKYDIISEGIILHETGSERVKIEPRFLHEFFDYQIQMKQNNLTTSI